LRDCFSKEQLRELTIAMFKDLATTLLKVKVFDEKVVYCNTSEILELADQYSLASIRERLTKPRKTFDEVINDLNNIALNKFKAKDTVFTFLDIILISSKNFEEIYSLLRQNQLVVCPAIHSAGISVLGRSPPNIIPTYFSKPEIPSLVALLNEANKRNLKIEIYDSFRAGFDIDIKQDLVLAYEYLKIFKLFHTETYKYLKNNLKLFVYKKNIEDNRDLEIKQIE
jgi:2-phospho-L-lactate guanylyltransferase (CobY/MobA/RfbA family)